MSSSSSDYSDAEMPSASVPRDDREFIGWDDMDPELMFQSSPTTEKMAPPARDDGGEWPSFDAPTPAKALKKEILQAKACDKDAELEEIPDDSDEDVSDAGDVQLPPPAITIVRAPSPNVVEKSDCEEDVVDNEYVEEEDYEEDVEEEVLAAPAVSVPAPTPKDTADQQLREAKAAQEKRIREEKEAELAAAEKRETQRRLEQAEQELALSKQNEAIQKLEADQAAEKTRRGAEALEKARRESVEAKKVADREKAEAEEAKKRDKEARDRLVSTLSLKKAPAPETRETPSPVFVEKPAKTAKDIDELLKNNAKQTGQAAEAQKSAASLMKLQKALQELHAYMHEPVHSRAPVFENGFFSAQSKDVTEKSAQSVNAALGALNSLASTGKSTATSSDENEDITTMSDLTEKISRVLFQFISSVVAVPSEKRRAVAQALIARVVEASERMRYARTAQMIAFTLAQMLVSEAASLKTASLVASSDEQKLLYLTLRAKILTDIENFVEKAQAVVPTDASMKNIFDKIVQISSKFASVATHYTPISGNNDGAEKTSHAVELSALLRLYVRNNSATSLFEGDETDYLTTLMLNSLFLLPDTLAFPEATYDVLSGMLSGVSSVIGIIENTADRARVIAYWKEIKIILSAQINDQKEMAAASKLQTLIGEKKKPALVPKPTTQSQQPAAPKSQNPAKATVDPTAEKTAIFKRRFEADSDDE